MAKLYICLILATISNIYTASQMRSELYNIKRTRMLTNYVQKWKTSSELLCAENCKVRPDCNTFAYSKATRQCYFKTNTRPKTICDVFTNGVTAYTPALRCSKPDGINGNIKNVVLRTSGLVGTLICKGDYMYVGNSPTAICSGTGTWSVNGVCKQRIWRNIQMTSSLELPDRINTGWVMCIMAIVCTDCVQFSFNLVNTTAETFVFHVRLDCDRRPIRAALNTRVDGEWDTERYVPLPSDVQLGQPLSVELRLLALTELQVVVNGADLYNFTAPLPISNADVFYFASETDASVDFLDTWSGCPSLPVSTSQPLVGMDNATIVGMDNATFVDMDNENFVGMDNETFVDMDNETFVGTVG